MKKPQLFDDLPASDAGRLQRGITRCRVAVRYREPLPQPEGRRAQFWALELLATRDAERKAQCYSNMIAALLALDRTRGIDVAHVVWPVGEVVV